MGSWREEGKSKGLITDLLGQNDLLGPTPVSAWVGHPAPVSVLADVPLSYSHYYSNPSYHTLSQCSPHPPPPNKVSAGGGVHCGEMGKDRLLWKAPFLLLAHQVPGSQLFASLQAPERPGGAHGPDNHTTLPADWKHRREVPPGPLERGRSLDARPLGRVGVCSWRPAPAECASAEGFWAPDLQETRARVGHQGSDCALPPPPQVAATWTEAIAVATATVLAQAHSTVKVCAQGGGARGGCIGVCLGAGASPEPKFFLLSSGPISEEGLGASVASLSSENPYATIRDLPSLLGGLRESSYVEMKGPPSGSPPRQPPQLRDSQSQRYPPPQRDSGTYEQPSALTHGEPSFSTGAW